MERFGLILAGGRIRWQPRNGCIEDRHMAESKEINPDTWGDFDPQEDGDVETIPNEERDCGYLKADNAYIRCDPAAFSEDGVIPGFVAITDDFGDLHPIPYKESLPRGYETVNGSNFMAAAESHRNFTPLYPGDPDADESHQQAHMAALENMVDLGVYDSPDAAPDSELSRHLDRMAIDGFEGEDHWGAIPPAISRDLMMRVGKSYYDHPWDFIDEALELGLNKGISVHSNKSPPPIQAGRTRVWLIHPHACGEDMPGVIGFAYLTRTIYTLDKDGDIPAYAQDYADAGKLDVVDIGEPIPQDEDDERDYDDIAEQHQSLDEFDVGGSRDRGHEPGRPAPEFDAGHIEAMERADLASLAKEGWVPANPPPESLDAVYGGDVVAIVDGQKVVASNNFTWDPEAQHGSQRSGPYEVRLRIPDTGDRMVKVEQ